MSNLWEQKKANANTPQVYPPLYGQTPGGLSGHQLQQQQALQQQFQHSLPHYQQMTGHMAQPLGSGMAQGLGPPPPYSPYSESQQQQVKYMQQMAYNPNQYMANPSVASHVQQQQQSSVASPQHSYPNPYQTNPYQTSGLYQYNPYSNLPPNSTLVMPHGFDAGARFDGVSRPGVPPPPPGVAPNPAQMAAMQGQNVVIGQKKGSFLEGGSSGGYTFW